MRWIAILAVLLGVIVGAPGARAESGASIDHIVRVTDRWLQVFVRSPAMAGTVQIDVLLPRDRTAPRPTVYLLEGIDSARPDQNDWTFHGGAVEYFADKDVNVVLPVGGAGSYYTDWQRDDRVRGHQKWETLLTRELPPLLDARFDGSGRAAVLGISMGAQAALMLAERSGDLYAGVAALSGCFNTADAIGQAELRYIVGTDGSDPDAMWGAANDPDWAAHDVLTHADHLRGKALYFYAASGLPGEHENLSTPDLPDVVFEGGAIEFGTRLCTDIMHSELDGLAIPATYDFAPAGTHSWPYWRDHLAAAWPVLAKALGG
ncbi:alpha/beta hydrolase [Nocardia sp. CDC160]|uniref:alpha/beta hydrolase n=1 Tax=Nocardia sp. CDC160 TaxID=3112166 RepID=UPI002DB6613C|nr:alpha/beta hydrolase family protein [Nocardia sp. CDC160]MEC3914673.1 alpha/beta hydrolase family protein [Nocardia sp. CDC160]